jgi:DMSO/TMAO reductase YedYZ molybdopterin-dependent catalytic subunit
MDYNQKMIAAKMKLLERFRKEKRERAASQERSRLPPGQAWTDGFPVLDLGVHPEFDPATWELRVFGEVENPVALSWGDFRRLPRAEQTSDFHCVTTWSKKDVRWSGVRMADVLALVRPKPTANFVIQHCADGYTTNASVFEASHADALLADGLDGKSLPLAHGGPVRMVIPTLYAWKSAKFLRALEFSARDKPGYWETRGYHNDADPWKEQRTGQPPAGDGFASAAGE